MLSGQLSQHSEQDKHLLHLQDKQHLVFSYTVNFIDVFVNGIKLTEAEFTATNGTTVVLAVGCFVGDIVELVSLQLSLVVVEEEVIDL